MSIDRPQTTVILAMSADGKIADAWRSPARFGSETDKRHLQTQIAQADAVLFGANTLRAYGTTLRVTAPELVQQRQQRQLPPQPVQIVCSRSAQLERHYRFFQQPVPRWLLTTPEGAKQWDAPEFEQILTPFTAAGSLDWMAAFEQFARRGLGRLVVTGGGELIASLLAVDLIDELWLTLCPLLLGGSAAPTPVTGPGFIAKLAPRLQLLSAQAIDQEVFLHYQLQRQKN